MRNGRGKWFVAAFLMWTVPAIAAAATLPVSYTVNAKDLTKNAPAGTMVTIELHQDAACSAAIATQTVDIASVEVIESSKAVKIVGGTKKPTIARINAVFNGVTPTPGSDLYVKVTAASGITPIDGSCQAQQPAGGASPAASGGYAHIFNTAPQNVEIGASVVFDTNGEVSPEIVHAPFSSAIVVTTAATWQVNWAVTAVEPNQFALFRNGNLIHGSRYGSGAGSQQNNGQMIVSLQAGDVIELRNDASASAVSLVPSTGGTEVSVNASITFWQR